VQLGKEVMKVVLVTASLGGIAEKSFGDQVVIKEVMEKILCTHFVCRKGYTLSHFLDIMMMRKTLASDIKVER
jgi:hypothetical protein